MNIAQPDALVSVIICTYGRATPLQDLLKALERQVYQNFEVFVIDGNEDPSPAHQAIEAYLTRAQALQNVILIASEKGLTRQRNVGLRAANGDLICFLDDDVTFQEDFLQEVAKLFEQPDMQDVGGITPYDMLHYPTPVTLRWRLRAMLGVMPGLDPGRVDHLGRAVPLSFLKPWLGKKEIGWLPGFCMIYRQAALEGLWFDELLPTYGGEDRDFSMRVGERHRLLFCGDLRIEHHYTRECRDDSFNRLRESSFGAGRRFAKYGRGFRDYLTMARTFAGDFLVDLVALVRSPGSASLLAPFVRIQASFAGMRSTSVTEARQTRPAREIPLNRNQIPMPVPNDHDH
jgi:glycosyltransferase involved in cell wall biosynthesis